MITQRNDELLPPFPTCYYCYNHGEMIGPSANRVLLPISALLMVGACSCNAATQPLAGTSTPILSDDSSQTQSLPAPGTAGPWDQDVLVFVVSTDDKVTRTATFERSGVPTLSRMEDGRIIAAHQFFPANDTDGFDKMAIRFSSDDGYTWTDPEVIRLVGLPEGMRSPFDPTLVVLPDGKIRLYFTSLHGKRFEEDVPAIYSAISTNGLDYGFEPGTRFGISGRPVIDCAVVLHQGIFHLYSPDNGVQLNPNTNQKDSQPDSLPNQGAGYHATSPDGLTFTRTEDVKIDGARRWLGNAQSDGEAITFWGTSQNANPPAGANAQQSAGIWMASSADGKVWDLIEAPRVNGADPGAVAARKGGWIVVATGPPRPGTASEQRVRTERTPPVPGQPPLSPGPPVSGSEGPWNHRVLLASSVDGLSWLITDELVIEHASVPELFLGPDGDPILLFVDASGKTEPGTMGAMARQTDGSWVRRRTTLLGADPNVVLLQGGSYRAYTKESDGNIMAFASSNGLDWRFLGEAFRDIRYPEATDPDVFETPSGWAMLVSLGPRLLRCTSADGIKFVAGEVIDLGGSVSDTVALPDGWRTFFHVNASPQSGGKMLIRSAFSRDGLKWRIAGRGSRQVTRNWPCTTRSGGSGSRIAQGWDLVDGGQIIHQVK